MTFSRLILLQNGLRAIRGHWLRETAEWKRAAEALGLAWCGFAHADLDKNIAEKLDVKPIFSFWPSMSLRARENRALSKLATFIEIPASYAAACRQHLSKDISARDLVVVPFATNLEIYGVAQWLKTLPDDKKPTVACIFHHHDMSWNLDIANGKILSDVSMWEYAAMTLMQHLPEKKLGFYAFNTPLADIMASVIRIPVKVSPLVHKMPDYAVPDYHSKKYALSVIGGARDEQGIGLSIRIIAELAALHPDRKMLLQINNQKQLEAYGKPMPATVDIYCGQLIDSDFDRALGESRWLLMPYLPQAYLFRESGIFSEAVAIAVPAAVSEGTSMSQHIRDGNAAGVTFRYGEDAAAIAKQIAPALQNGESFAQHATRLQDAWRAQHDATSVLKQIVTDLSY